MVQRLVAAYAGAPCVLFEGGADLMAGFEFHAELRELQQTKPLRAVGPTLPYCRAIDPLSVLSFAHYRSSLYQTGPCESSVRWARWFELVFVVLLLRCTEAPSARIGVSVTTPSYACRQPLLDTNAVTATSPPNVYAVLAVGIGVCHPALMTRYLHTELAASGLGSQETTTSK
jgi:hypothetical protein